MEKFSSLISSILLALSLVIVGFFVGGGLEKFNRAERTISVRGLAEKDVMSNVAVWKLNFSVSSENMNEVRNELPKVQKIVTDFLKEQGFVDAEISKNSSIKDRQAQEYGGDKGSRFVAYNSIVVSTSQAEKVSNVRELVGELVKNGVVLTGESVEYYFTNLNEIKPEMLDLATRNAKEAALGFAKSMDVGVGKLKRASQGVFSIESPIGGSGDGEYGSYSGGSLQKKVRVVTQVEFYID